MSIGIFSPQPDWSCPLSPPEEQSSEEIQFDDLAKLVNRDIQFIVRDMKEKDIAVCLKGAKEEVRDKIFSNVSQRVGAVIREEMRLTAAAKVSEVQDVRQQLMQRVRGLQVSGEITWPPTAVLRRESLEPRPRPAQWRKPPVKPASQSRNYIIGLVATVGVIGLLVVITGKSKKSASSGADSSQKTTGGRSVVSSGKSSSISSPKKAAGSESRKRKRKQQADSESSSSVTGSQGPVYIVSGNSRTSAEDAQPKPGDKVETGTEGKAILDLEDNSARVQVGPNSSLEIGAAQVAGSLSSNFNLWVGNVIVEVNDPELVMNSPVAGITGSEGARYRLRVVLDATTTITAHEGVIRIIPTVGADRKQIVLRRGDRVKIYPTGKIQKDRVTSRK